MNKKITELPNATLPVTTGVKFEGVQGGINVQIDADDMPGSAAGVTSVTGTPNRVTSTGGATPVIDISATFEALLAKLAGPQTFTGIHNFPTPSAGDSSTLAATTAFVAGELGFSFVSVTGAVTLDSTAFGKMHICTGTVSAYTIGLPTAVGNANKSIAFKGSSLLTVNVTIDGNSGETLDGEDSRQFNGGGLFVILSDGTNWHIVAEVGSWVTYTPVWTGLSADPVMSEAKYWRTGKNCIVQWRSGTDGTSNATTKTITFPFNAYAVVQFASITSVRNNGTTQAGPGYLQTRASSNVVDIFRDALSTAWTATGGFRASGTVIYQVA